VANRIAAAGQITVIKNSKYRYQFQKMLLVG